MLEGHLSLRHPAEDGRQHTGQQAEHRGLQLEQEEMCMNLKILAANKVHIFLD